MEIDGGTQVPRLPPFVKSWLHCTCHFEVTNPCCVPQRKQFGTCISPLLFDSHRLNSCGRYRAVFNSESKAISRLLWFCWLRSLIGLLRKTLAHFLNQWKSKLAKPIVTWSHAFSHAWRRLDIFPSSCDWLVALLITFVNISQSDYFGSAFASKSTRTLNWKLLLNRPVSELVSWGRNNRTTV